MGRSPTSPGDSPPVIAYAPDAEVGGIYVERRGQSLTVILPPVGWRGHVVPFLMMASIAAGLPLVVAFRLLGPLAHPPTQLFVYGMVVALWLIGLYLLAYGYHFAARRVRVDVDGNRIRRTIHSPFGRFERAWDRRRVVAVVSSDEGGEPGSAQTFYFLFIRTRGEKQHVLLDSPDPEQIAAVAAALREALGLEERRD